MIPFNNKNSNQDSSNFVHATVVTSQKIIDLMGQDLSVHFTKHKVSLLSMSKAVTFGPDAITLVLAGKENDIKKSLSQLKKICQDKETGIETTSIKSLPPAIKEYLSDMEDNLRYEKLFDYCSKEYLEYCRSHNVAPHPEVVN